MLTSNQPSRGTALGDDLAAIADQAIHQRDVGAVGFALEVVGLRDVARHEDMRFEAGRGRVGGQRAGGVSGGRDRDFLHAEFEAHGNGAGKPARFERRGGVQAFVLDPDGLRADARAETVRADERRPAFAERNDGIFRGGQNRRVTPHGGRAVARRRAGASARGWYRDRSGPAADRRRSTDFVRFRRRTAAYTGCIPDAWLWTWEIRV